MFRRPGAKGPGLHPWLVQRTGTQPAATSPGGVEYQYGSHEAAIKGSVAAGYGLVFGAAIALFAAPAVVRPAKFVQTVPQEPTYQASYVNAPSPALYAVAAKPVIHSILGQGQENLEQRGSATYGIQQAQRPVFGTIQTVPQQSPEQAPSAVYTTTTRLQRPLFGQVLTAPQADLSNNASATYRAQIVPVTAGSPVIASILGSSQQDLTQQGSVVFHLPPAQRPLFTAILTAPQTDQTQPGSVIYGLAPQPVAATPALRPWLQTWPQESQQQAPSAVYAQTPPTVAPQVPGLTTAILTAAEWPQIGPSSVQTTNIPLALAAPALKGSIGTQAEQPQPVPSWSLVNTAILPSFVAGIPPLTTWIQTIPQDQGLYDVNASVVQTPTAANIPDTPPPVAGSNPGDGVGGSGGDQYPDLNSRYNTRESARFEFAKKSRTVPDVVVTLGDNAAQTAEVAINEVPRTSLSDDDLAVMLLLGVQVSEIRRDDDDEAITVLLI